MQQPSEGDQEIASLLEDHSKSATLASNSGTWKTTLSRFTGLFWKSGAACALAFSTCSSLNALFVRLAGMPVFEVVLFRSIVGCLVTCIVAALSGELQSLKGQQGTRGLLAVRGIAGSASMSLRYQAILMLPLADAVTIAKLAPIFTAILAALLVAEPLTCMTGAFSSLGIIGVVLVAHPPFLFGGHAAWDSHRLIGVVLDLVGAMVQAVAGTAVRKIRTAEPALVVAFWYHAISLIISAVGLVSGKPEFPVMPRPAAVAMMLAIGFESFLGQLCWARAFQIGNAARMSAITYVDVVYAHVFGVTIWREHETVLGLTGSALVVGGALGASLEQKSKSKVQVDEGSLPTSHAPSSSQQGLAMQPQASHPSGIPQQGC